MQHSHQISRQDALDYHVEGRRGKIEVVPTTPVSTQLDLSLAYSPGVAHPCNEIAEKTSNVWKYTARSNLVAVVTNGSAVLGLGDIGPEASKPVMEGKGVLFKRFADIDVFDLELDTDDVDEFVRTVRSLEPTFGGINLEDIKAPDCFEIERRLADELSIPVFHDDQHGTAIISAAALLNALDLADKAIEDVRLVISGAGAAGIACAEIYEELGLPRENMILCDSKGVIHEGREEGMNAWKEAYAVKTDRRTLADAMEGADVFLGMSIGGLVDQDMVRSMADRPIIFACANPDPEITYPEAKEARPDAIMATGRSDYPNQVNNVLGFPFIFRGALDTAARAINMEMKVAAARALARLAREDVPDAVQKRYPFETLQYGPDYIIPKPFDSRVLLWVAPAVARAAAESGVARKPIDDLDAYREKLEKLLSRTSEVMRPILNQAKRDPKRVVLFEGADKRTLRALLRIVEEGVARPILIGDPGLVRERIDELALNLPEEAYEVVDPGTDERTEDYAEELYDLRCRKGVTEEEAHVLIRNPTAFAAMMVHRGDADAMVGGHTQSYPATIRPALQVIGAKENFSKVAGLYMLILEDRVLFFADTTVNIETGAEELADIAIMSHDAARIFVDEPRVAMISFSNFGSTSHPRVAQVHRAMGVVEERRPDIVIDGEMQADTAVTPEILAEHFPFSHLADDGANVLIFPSLEAANVAYKLVQRLADADAVGPILMGMRKPVHVLQRAASVPEIVNMTAIATVEAQVEQQRT